MEIEIPFTNNLLSECLYFTSSSFSRIMNSIAEEEFRKTGLSPNQGFILLLVHENPGMNQSDIAKRLELQPSTVTRFVDKLERAKFVERVVEGRERFLHPTKLGETKAEEVKYVWLALDERYKKLLGVDKVFNIVNLLNSSIELLNTKD